MEETVGKLPANIINLLHELIFEIDKAFHIKFMNKACEKALNYSKKDYFDKQFSIKNILHPKDSNRFIKSARKAFKGLTLSENQYKLYDKNKNELILNIKIIGDNQNGSTTSIICLATEVANKDKPKVMDEDRFKHVFDNFPIPYQSLNIKGEIINVNPEWSKRLGYSREEAIGKNFKLFICEKDKEGFDVAYEKYIEEGEIKNAPVNIVTKKGKIISVNYIGKVEYNATGDFLRTHCVINDISEQEQTAKSLIESEQRLRDLNSTKDKFFSIIAHDLKNPFNDIMGFTQLLGLNIEIYDKPKIKQFVEIIHQSSRLAYNLLENLLNWSRSQTGTLKFKPEKILINNLIKENILLLDSIANNKNIKIYAELDSEVYAFADENMVRTIIRNLISNAIKYTNQGGYIKLGIYTAKKNCEISITDSGIGIEKDDLHKIFRIEEGYTTLGTEKEKGTGLGLILCKEFVEKNGGQIWVKSEPKKGSTFTFTLPLPEPEFPETEL